MALTHEEKEALRAVIDRTSGHRETGAATRVVPEEYKAFQEQVERKELTLPLEAPAAPVRLVISTAKEKAEKCPVHVNMHGGGFVYPQDPDDDMYCAHIAAATHGIVVDIDYATSWEGPFPLAFEQCYAVMKWVYAQCEAWGADPDRISMGGHSAGGTLTAAISLRNAVKQDFPVCLQVLDYAALDNNNAVQPGGNERSRAFSTLYCDGDFRVLKLPFCSPCFATDEMLKDHPATLVVNAGHCPFREGNETYAMRLAAAGCEVTIREYLDSPHGFTVRLAGQWQQAQARIIRAINEATL